jgi:hypothetical protein
LSLHIQFGDHGVGWPFGKNLIQNLIEEEIQEIEAQTVAQVMDMESEDTAVYRSTPIASLLHAVSLYHCTIVGSMVQGCLACLT